MNRIEPNYVMRGHVERIVDGDSLEVYLSPAFHWGMKNIRLRLRGVNTPELRSSDPVEREDAQAAKAFVTSLIPPGTEIIVQTFVTSGGNYKKTFDRYVADVYFDDEDGRQICLNEKLINSGHGVAMEM